MIWSVRFYVRDQYFEPVCRSIGIESKKTFHTKFIVQGVVFNMVYLVYHNSICVISYWVVKFEFSAYMNLVKFYLWNPAFLSNFEIDFWLIQDESREGFHKKYVHWGVKNKMQQQVCHESKYRVQYLVIKFDVSARKIYANFQFLVQYSSDDSGQWMMNHKVMNTWKL